MSWDEEYPTEALVHASLEKGRKFGTKVAVRVLHGPQKADSSSSVPLPEAMQDSPADRRRSERQRREVEVTPEVAAAVGVAGQDRGGRRAVWLSGRSGQGFVWTSVAGGDLSWILLAVRSFRVFKR